MIALAKSRRNARFSGCSSMVEQQLPKLHATAKNLPSPSKTRRVTSVSIQTLGFRAQNNSGRNSAPTLPGPTDEREETRRG